MFKKKRSTLIKLFFVLVMMSALAACSNGKKEKEAQKIDEAKVIKKLEGEWLAEKYDGKVHTITYSKDVLHFDEVPFKIKKVGKNKVETREVSDEKSRYSFEILKDSIMLYRTYVVEEDSDNEATEGELAPIELRKVQKEEK
ncbi:hypothetical protein IGI37_000993 [Enterococcus sp. AZ194]|uniref:hypothetical protein n=1 Tax=Enterococcus sp. AZ194 TaxID=2774629 RepID=UPI003F271B77